MVHWREVPDSLRPGAQERMPSEQSSRSTSTYATTSSESTSNTFWQANSMPKPDTCPQNRLCPSDESLTDQESHALQLHVPKQRHLSTAVSSPPTAAFLAPHAPKGPPPSSSKKHSRFLSFSDASVLPWHKSSAPASGLSKSLGASAAPMDNQSHKRHSFMPKSSRKASTGLVYATDLPRPSAFDEMDHSPYDVARPARPRSRSVTSQDESQQAPSSTLMRRRNNSDTSLASLTAPASLQSHGLSRSHGPVTIMPRPVNKAALVTTRPRLSQSVNAATAAQPSNPHEGWQEQQHHQPSDVKAIMSSPLSRSVGASLSRESSPAEAQLSQLRAHMRNRVEAIPSRLSGTDARWKPVAQPLASTSSATAVSTGFSWSSSSAAAEGNPAAPRPRDVSDSHPRQASLQQLSQSRADGEPTGQQCVFFASRQPGHQATQDLHPARAAPKPAAPPLPGTHIIPKQDDCEDLPVEATVKTPVSDEPSLRPLSSPNNPTHVALEQAGSQAPNCTSGDTNPQHERQGLAHQALDTIKGKEGFAEGVASGSLVPVKSHNRHAECRVDTQQQQQCSTVCEVAASSSQNSHSARPSPTNQQAVRSQVPQSSVLGHRVGTENRQIQEIGQLSSSAPSAHSGHRLSRVPLTLPSAPTLDPLLALPAGAREMHLHHRLSIKHNSTSCKTTSVAPSTSSGDAARPTLLHDKLSNRPVTDTSVPSLLRPTSPTYPSTPSTASDLGTPPIPNTCSSSDAYFGSQQHYSSAAADEPLSGVRPDELPLVHLIEEEKENAFNEKHLIEPSSPSKRPTMSTKRNLSSFWNLGRRSAPTSPQFEQVALPQVSTDRQPASASSSPSRPRFARKLTKKHLRPAQERSSSCDAASRSHGRNKVSPVAAPPPPAQRLAAPQPRKLQRPQAASFSQRSEKPRSADNNGCISRDHFEGSDEEGAQERRPPLQIDVTPSQHSAAPKAPSGKLALAINREEAAVRGGWSTAPCSPVRPTALEQRLLSPVEVENDVAPEINVDTGYLSAEPEVFEQGPDDSEDCHPNMLIMRTGRRRSRPTKQRTLSGLMGITDDTQFLQAIEDYSAATSAEASGSEESCSPGPSAGSETKAYFVIRELLASEKAYAANLAKLNITVSEPGAYNHTDFDLITTVRKAACHRVSTAPNLQRVQSSKTIDEHMADISKNPTTVSPVELLQEHLPSLVGLSSDLSSRWDEDPSPEGIGNALLLQSEAIESCFMDWMRVFPWIRDAFRQSELNLPVASPPITVQDSRRKLIKDRRATVADEESLMAAVAKELPEAIIVDDQKSPYRRRSWAATSPKARKMLKGEIQAAERRVLVIHDILIAPFQRLTRYALFLVELLKHVPCDSSAHTLIARALITVRTVLAQCDEKQASSESSSPTRGPSFYAESSPH